MSDAELRALQYVIRHGGIPEAAHHLRKSPSTLRNQLAAASRRTGMTREQLAYHGAREGWLRLA